MNLVSGNIVEDKFAFSSSVSGDVWHPRKDEKAYEWWYFDALSDDGSEAITLAFLDNSVYSPRYNHAGPVKSDNSIVDGIRFPAVAFTYFRDGKQRYRTMLEFPESAFHASDSEPFVSIGENSMTFRTASYGAGYHIQLDAALSGGRRLRANFEWLAIESDHTPEATCFETNAHCWNMVAPRCDVTGKIGVYGRKNREIDIFQFRGTGYHDHKLDNRWLAKTVRDWHWGRAHFADATAVFYRFREINDDRASTRLLIVKDAELSQRKVEFEEQNYVRNKLGIRYPTRLRLISEDGVRLTARPLKVIDSTFFHLRFLSEMTLTFDGSPPSTSLGITEFLMPRGLTRRWLTWLGDMRTGRNGRGPWLR
ncbi:MAG TPA: hypothetical protein VK468_08900 [Pyrinomonadaceae bacterium]|nr:hypothetical protein [Pyrinomonadaceae bacterium]